MVFRGFFLFFKKDIDCKQSWIQCVLPSWLLDPSVRCCTASAIYIHPGFPELYYHQSGTWHKQSVLPQIDRGRKACSSADSVLQRMAQERQHPRSDQTISSINSKRCLLIMLCSHSRQLHFDIQAFELFTLLFLCRLKALRLLAGCTPTFWIITRKNTTKMME